MIILGLFSPIFNLIVRFTWYVGLYWASCSLEISKSSALLSYKYIYSVFGPVLDIDKPNPNLAQAAGVLGREKKGETSNYYFHNIFYTLGGEGDLNLHLF